MRLTSLTTIGWCVNIAFDQGRSFGFSFDDIYAAVDRRDLCPLLLEAIDDNGILALCMDDVQERKQVEAALADAAEGLRNREMRKAGVGDKPLCLVMALVLEAVQRHCVISGS